MNHFNLFTSRNISRNLSVVVLCTIEPKCFFVFGISTSIGFCFSIFFRIIFQMQQVIYIYLIARVQTIDWKTLTESNDFSNFKIHQKKKKNPMEKKWKFSNVNIPIRLRFKLAWTTFKCQLYAPNNAARFDRQNIYNVAHLRLVYHTLITLAYHRTLTWMW